ncbi:MAG TPA: PQQ-dependent sugar dehydrogenase [Candidatus Binatia bacterium]|nr:PQQ-dependent sugar dehydrogenase [Candidatus Binatia bacterium]
MATRFRLAVSVLTLLFVIAAPPVHAATPLHTVRIASGLSKPLFVTSPPGDTARLFIVEQRGADNRGRIRIFKNGAVLARAFLTTAVLSTGTEQGLLGLAFAPDYATTGRFYIDYTASDGTTIIERHTVSADPDSASPAGTTILSIPQPYANHNGGWIGFGPDGYLYIGMGDGGSADDPQDRAQNLNVLYGKILRIDVSGATYASPPTNPFFGATAGLDEIWDYGLRNPWRPSFDRRTGDLVIADVGQNAIEEVDFEPAGSGGGRNYGWRCYEGTPFHLESATTPCGMCVAAACPKVFPAYEYDHSLSRCSITGGYVYRGCVIPDLQGTYFFADYCSGAIYSGRFVGGAMANVIDRTAELAPGGGLSIGSITSFGEDARGELYICDGGGEVFKIVPSAPVAASDMPVLRRATALGDTLGSTTPGNALLPGITAFADAGSRIRGVGFLNSAAIRECASAPTGCLASRLRVGVFDIDVQACVDSVAGRLTRQLTFTNRSGASQPLAYVDVIAPYLNGDEDGATTAAPSGSGQSATLVLYDSFQSTRYVRHWGTASSGAVFSADVDTAAQVAAEVAADKPLAGGTSAGPARLALALGFDFGSVASGASRTATITTDVLGSPPSGVTGSPPAPQARLLEVAPIPFRSELKVALTLARGERGALDVFDVRGRLVRHLARGTFPAGVRRLTWDGRITSGGSAPAGIYFVRYTGEGAIQVRRAVRLR